MAVYNRDDVGSIVFEKNWAKLFFNSLRTRLFFRHDSPQRAKKAILEKII
jgi:hypothetical protein